MSSSTLLHVESIQWIWLQNNYIWNETVSNNLKWMLTVFSAIITDKTRNVATNWRRSTKMKRKQKVANKSQKITKSMNKIKYIQQILEENEIWCFTFCALLTLTHTSVTVRYMRPTHHSDFQLFTWIWSWLVANLNSGKTTLLENWQIFSTAKWILLKKLNYWFTRDNFYVLFYLWLIHWFFFKTLPISASV